MAEAKYNRNNPAVKRILQEVKEMQSNPSDDFMSLPLEEDIFEWHFVIRGPGDSEFEGGIYHGRIQLPAEYPFQPPAFQLLTPNGRFETQTKICLSISNHHPEHWQPSWSVRTALLALIAFMPTNPNGALGSLEYKKEERRALAIKSREAAPKIGSPERQILMDEIHEYLLSKAPPVPQVFPSQASDEQTAKIEEDVQENPSSNDTREVLPESTSAERVVEEEVQPQALPQQREMPHHVSPVQMPRTHPAPTRGHPQVEMRVAKQADDRVFTWAAVGLTIAIVFLVLKKFLKANGHSAIFMDES